MRYINLLLLTYFTYLLNKQHDWVIPITLKLFFLFLLLLFVTVGELRISPWLAAPRIQEINNP